MVEDKHIIEGLQKAAVAEALVRDLKDALSTHSKDLKESIRYDLQNIINNNVKLSIKEALEENYNKTHRPHLEAIGLKHDTLNNRVIVVETKQKQTIWTGAGIAASVSVVFGLIKAGIFKIGS
jgi:hypothetical protein